MSLLNAFSGAVFLTVGVTHLLPEVLEFQAEAHPDMEFEIGLTFIVIGFALLLFVEQVCCTTPLCCACSCWLCRRCPRPFFEQVCFRARP